MDSSKRVQGLLSLLMLIATASLGWVGLATRGVVGRLGDTGVMADSDADRQDVVARMWEDPLQAVNFAERSRSSKGAAASAEEPDLIESLLHVLRIPSQKMEHQPEHHTTIAVPESTDAGGSNEVSPVLMLIIPIPDTPYPVDVETRIRTRYAMQMALAQHQFAPDTRERLGYCYFPFSAGTGKQQIPVHNYKYGKPIPMPYEWFTRPSGDEVPEPSPLSVLVIWLPDSLLESHPLGAIAQLPDLLRPNDHRLIKGIFLIGPNSSDGLKAFLTDDTLEDCSVKEILRRKLAIFSHQATTPDRLLERTTNANGKPREAIAAIIKSKFESCETSASNEPSWEYFTNLVALDDSLTDLLAAELRTRRISVTPEGDDRILLLVEADTTYGRSFPSTFKSSIASEYKLEPQDVDCNISAYHYLCGLDQKKGQLPSESAQHRRPATSPEDALTEALNKNRAMPLGESQLDYIERLTDTLDELESDSPAQGCKGTLPENIKAVGIFGSNIYDKLILIKTLRERFPYALFFTTDLDARIWHPDHLPFTKNLVVASSYHVTPAGQSPSNHHADIPPLRDVYQAATYQAISTALERIDQSNVSPIRTPDPRIFEIGLDGPVELTSPFSPIGGNGKIALSAPIRHPRAIFFLLLAVLCGALLWNYHNDEPWKERMRIRFGLHGDIVLISLLFVFLFWVMTWNLAQLPGSEPWRLFEGVSIWPTEMIRLSTILSIGGIALFAYHEHSKLIKSLQAIFQLNCDRSRTTSVINSQAAQAHDRFFRRLIRAFTDLFFQTSYDRSHTVETAVTDITTNEHSVSKMVMDYDAEYFNVGKVVRIALASLCYFVFAFAFVYLIDGGVPDNLHIRGPVAYWIDTVMAYTSTILFFCLVFFVLDEVIASTHLIRHVTGKGRNATEGEWPESLITELTNKYSVGRKILNRYLYFKLATEVSCSKSRLVYLPFVLIGLMAISRSALLDRWQWSAAIALIFLCNVVISSLAWLYLRRASQAIRTDVLNDIDHEIALLIRSEATEEYAANVSKKKQRQSRPNIIIRNDLKRLRNEINNEKRGAYSSLFQDPTVIAAMLPSGIVGVATILFYLFFGGVRAL